MPKIVKVDYYESTRGLGCYVRDDEGKSWYKRIEEVEDNLPGMEIDTNDWIFQNGKIYCHICQMWFTSKILV